jgi:putative membrane protein
LLIGLGLHNLRLIAWVVVGLITNAVALLIAATVVDGLDIDTLAFPIVVVVFTAIGALAQPVVEAFVEKKVQLLARVIGLIAAFVTLLVTDLVSSNLNVSGVSAWVLGTLIIWAASLLTGLIVGKRLYRRIAGSVPPESAA